MPNTTETVSVTRNLTGNFNGQIIKLRQITVEEYDSMIENGVFDEDDRLELLINGAIVEKMPKGNKHSAATDRIAKFFDRNLTKFCFSEIKIRFGSMIIPNPNQTLFWQCSETTNTKTRIRNSKKFF